jgi:hypothetical protein
LLFVRYATSRGLSFTGHQHNKDEHTSPANRLYCRLKPPTRYTGLSIVVGRANRKEERVTNSQHRDEGRGPMDRVKGGAEEIKDTPTTNENERDEGRSARARRVYEEKKAASPGPSSL